MISAIEILRGSSAHLTFTLVAAILFAVAIALLGRRSIRERVAYSAYLLASSMAWVIAGSWLMRLIHG